MKQIDPRALKEFAEAAARYAKTNPWKPVHAANARGRLSRLLGSLGGANDAWKREADRLLVQQLHAILANAGSATLASMHDAAMPDAVHRLIDSTFVTVWPEVEKGMLDELLLSMGFQFAAFRKRLGDHYSTAATGAAPPRNLPRNSARSSLITRTSSPRQGSRSSARRSSTPRCRTTFPSGACCGGRCSSRSTCSSSSLCTASTRSA